MPKEYMIHLNGNHLCVIDVETTGTIPGYHDLIQVAFLPLDSKLEPRQDILPFYCDLQPKRPENWDPESSKVTRTTLLDVQERGIEPYRAADLFDEWLLQFKFAPNKRLSPLAHNWPFDRGFIIDWLGRESFNQYIDGRYRDSMAVALYENDRADFMTEPYPFAKVNLPWLAKQYNIPHDRAHDALADCLVTAKVYKKQVLGQLRPVSVDNQ